MIGADARGSVERIMRKAVKTRLAQGEDLFCDIETLPAEAASTTRGDQAVVLTISSIAFRLLMLVHFNDDDRTRHYFVQPGGAGGDDALREGLFEACNLCCGVINQELVEHFPDLGMSTPFLLDAACVPYLHELESAWLAPYAVTLAGDVRLTVTLCLCTSAPLDFVAHVVEEEDAGGELELF